MHLYIQFETVGKKYLELKATQTVSLNNHFIAGNIDPLKKTS